MDSMKKLCTDNKAKETVGDAIHLLLKGQQLS
jgi:hypothetical protein